MVQYLHYFPCICSVADLMQQAKLQLDGDLSFQRSSFRNRTIIAGADGPITLSIPVVGGRSVKSVYRAVQIDYTSNWQRDHFRTICTVYGNSPFFIYYKDELESLFTEKSVYLFDWNLLCLQWVFKKLKLTISINEEDATGDQDKTSYNALEYSPHNYLDPTLTIIPYPQVFDDRNGFLPNLSVLDLLLNLGPDAKQYLFNTSTKPR